MTGKKNPGVRRRPVMLARGDVAVPASLT